MPCASESKIKYLFHHNHVMRDSGILFQERQRLKSPWMKAVLIGLAAIGVYIFIAQILLGMEVGDNPAPDFVVILLTVPLCIGLPLFFIQFTMTTEVHSAGIRVRMLKSFEYSNVDIRSFHAERFSWLKDYMGIGYRIGPKGAGFTMGGDTGVKLHLNNGRTIMIESDRYEEFLQALELTTGKDRSPAKGFEDGMDVIPKAKDRR